jgi:RNA polymerase sigma-54 factor
MRNTQRIGLTQTQRLALNTSLQASIALLRCDAAGLTRYLEEQAGENPHLRLGPPPVPQDWLPRWSGAFAAAGLGEAGAMQGAAPSLIAHVMAQIEALALPARAARIALELAEGLEPSGWLGPPVEEIARRCAGSRAEVEAVLKRLQRLDPAGIFARSLAECLRLQAEADEILTTELALVLDNLELLAAGDFARLARTTGLSETQVRAAFHKIRTLNPKPGADFADDSPALRREPDLLLRQEASGLSVALNHSSLPSLQIDPEAQGAAGGLAAARALQRMVEARNVTLLRVGFEVATRQQEAFRQGLIALVPMTMAEVAEALDLHESTISRVVAGSSIDTEHGTWWLRALFSQALGGNGQPVLSGASLRQRLARLIAADPADAPRSDAALATALAEETGITLARRTVAKYREDLGIPPAHRRRRKKLPPLGTKGRFEG